MTAVEPVVLWLPLLPSRQLSPQGNGSRGRDWRVAWAAQQEFKTDCIHAILACYGGRQLPRFEGKVMVGATLRVRSGRAKVPDRKPLYRPTDVTNMVAALKYCYDALTELEIIKVDSADIMELGAHRIERGEWDEEGIELVIEEVA